VSTAPELQPSEPPGIRPLFANLVDCAALFPPGSAKMPAAVRGYLDALAGDRAGIVGVFVCPVSRLPELIVEVVKAKPAEPLPISLVVDNGLGGVPKAVSTVESRRNMLRLRMVEMAAPSDVDATWLERVAEFVPEDVVRVVEPVRPALADRQAWLEGVRRVARYGCWPKLRCGGLRAGSFPAAGDVAEFMAAVCAENVPFKATAGLHHAIRYQDEETGYRHHGFVNLMVAVSRTLASGQVDTATAALESDDADELVTELNAMPESAARSLRQAFASYGSCSLDEPFDDLSRLGLL
jgi:hypothetical protein